MTEIPGSGTAGRWDGGGGVWGGGGWGLVEEGDYTERYTVTIRTTPALRIKTGSDDSRFNDS